MSFIDKELKKLRNENKKLREENAMLHGAVSAVSKNANQLIVDLQRQRREYDDLIEEAKKIKNEYQKAMDMAHEARKKYSLECKSMINSLRKSQNR